MINDRKGPTVRHDYSALIEQILEPFDVWKASSDRYRSCCPAHKGTNNTSFSVFSNGRFICFKCGARGDLARLVMFAKNVTLGQARDYINSSPQPFYTMADVPMLPAWEERRNAERYPVLPEATIAPFRRHCPRYLIERGFSQAALRAYEIGYDMQHGKIVIPVRDVRGKLVGLTYRTDFDDDKTQPAKYWHDNFAKAFHLYGFQRYANRPLRKLFLVEGQLDSIRMHQLGFAAVAIMGSEMSREQHEVLVKHCKAEQVVLAYDNDEAGEKATRSSIRQLCQTRFGPTLSKLRYTTKDPGELTEDSKVSLEPWYVGGLLPGAVA